MIIANFLILILQVDNGNYLGMVSMRDVVCTQLLPN